MIARLKRKYEKRIDRGTSDITEIKYWDMNQFKMHPLVTKKVSGHYSLGDEFYNDALRLHQQEFSIEKILGVYGIDA